MDAPGVALGRPVAALQALALSCLVLAAFLRLVASDGDEGTVVTASVGVALAGAIGVSWTLRSRAAATGHSAGLTVVTVVLVTPIAVFGSLGFTVPVLLLVVAFAVLDVSLRAGVFAVAWLVAVGSLLFVLSGSRSWPTAQTALGETLLNGVPVTVLLGFGVVLGLSLRAFELRRAADVRVIERLREASDLEKELLLSDERARSARELHDGLGHRLTVVALGLELAGRMRSVDQDEAWREVRTAHDGVISALAEVRTWVRALHPVRDPSARGIAALESIADSFRGTGVDVQVTQRGPVDGLLCRDEDVALLVYRSVQEGLTNALRHGHARRVEIAVGLDAVLELSITNDLGPGVAAGGAASPAFGFGLRGLSERAAALGGHIEVERLRARSDADDGVETSGADGAFRLLVRVPARRAAA